MFSTADSHNYDIPRERRFLFFLRCSLRASASSCGSGPFTSMLNIPKACSMPLSISEEKPLCRPYSGMGTSRFGMSPGLLKNRSKAFAENSLPIREPFILPGSCNNSIRPLYCINKTLKFAVTIVQL